MMMDEMCDDDECDGMEWSGVDDDVMMMEWDGDGDDDGVECGWSDG